MIGLRGSYIIISMEKGKKFTVLKVPSPLGGWTYVVVDTETKEIESHHPGLKAAEWHIENRLKREE